LSLANAFERRANVLFSEIARLTTEVLADPPEAGSTRLTSIVDKVGDLGAKFSRLAADVRRQNIQIDARLAGLSRYVRSEGMYRERQRQQSRQSMFRDVQLSIREISSALKLLTDVLAKPPTSVTAKGIHDLIEEFAKTVANFAQAPLARISQVATISMPAVESVSAERIQGAADLLLLFGILLNALYNRLKSNTR